MMNEESNQLRNLLRQSWQGMNQTFRRSLKASGITPDQFNVLSLLDNDNVLTQSQLTRSMASDPNTMTALVGRMEKAGLVERKAHETDKRAKCVCLSLAGKAKFAELEKLASNLETDALEAIPEGNRQALLESLSALALSF